MACYEKVYVVADKELSSDEVFTIANKFSVPAVKIKVIVCSEEKLRNLNNFKELIPFEHDVINVLGKFNQATLFESRMQTLWKSSSYKKKNKFRFLNGSANSALPFGFVLSKITKLLDESESIRQDKPVVSSEAKQDLDFYLLNNELINTLFANGQFDTEVIQSQVIEAIEVQERLKIMATYA